MLTPNYTIPSKSHLSAILEIISLTHTRIKMTLNASIFSFIRRFFTVYNFIVMDILPTLFSNPGYTGRSPRRSTLIFIFLHTESLFSQQMSNRIVILLNSSRNIVAIRFVGSSNVDNILGYGLLTQTNLASLYK